MPRRRTTFEPGAKPATTVVVNRRALSTVIASTLVGYFAGVLTAASVIVWVVSP
jgi:hypothetical protein